MGQVGLRVRTCAHSMGTRAMRAPGSLHPLPLGEKEQRPASSSPCGSSPAQNRGPAHAVSRGAPQSPTRRQVAERQHDGARSAGSSHRRDGSGRLADGEAPPRAGCTGLRLLAVVERSGHRLQREHEREEGERLPAAAHFPCQHAAPLLTMASGV